MKTTTTLWRISPLAWAAIAIAVTVEAAINALRAYGLGAHLERFTFTVAGTPVSLAGAVLVAARVPGDRSDQRRPPRSPGPAPAPSP